MEHHTLTNELFNNLLDPRIPTLDVCRTHGIPITDLRRILASPEFQEAAEALTTAEELRATALAPDRRERALATLDAITRQTPTTPTHTECIRRAAGAILRATKPEPRPSARAASAPPADTAQPTAPDNEHPHTKATHPDHTEPAERLSETPPRNATPSQQSPRTPAMEPSRVTQHTT